MKRRSRNLWGLFLGIVSTLLFFPVDGTVSQSLNAADEEDVSVFIGGLSPFILAPDHFEINNQALLVSYWIKVQTSGRDGTLSQNAFRQTLFQDRASIHYGFSRSQKWDLGADVTYTRQRLDDAARNSPTDVFSSDIQNKRGISTVGVKARVAPFARAPGLVFQGNIRFPVANGDELRRDLGADRMQYSFNSSFFNRFNYGNSYFVQVGWSMNPDVESDFSGALKPSTHVLSGGAYIITNLWNQRLFLMPGISYSGTFQNSVRGDGLLQRSHSVFADAVLQLQFSSKVSMNIQNSYPLLFESYTPLIAFDRRSLTAHALSFRIAF